MKKFFVFLLIVAGCLFLLYKTGNLSVDTIKAQIVSNIPISNNNGANAVQAPIETQANGLPIGAVKEGKALIEGVRLYDKGVLVNNTYSEGVKNLTSFFTGKYEKFAKLHIITAYYSTTLGENIIIDAHIPSGERHFCKLDGTKFYRVSGDSLVNQSAEQSMQTYVAMKGLANAIDGK